MHSLVLCIWAAVMYGFGLMQAAQCRTYTG